MSLPVVLVFTPRGRLVPHLRHASRARWLGRPHEADAAPHRGQRGRGGRPPRVWPAVLLALRGGAATRLGLARALGLSPRAVYHALRTLVGRGFARHGGRVLARADDAWRWQALWVITPRGRVLLRRGARAAERLDEGA